MNPVIVTVPDLPAVELTALVERDMKIKGLRDDYRQWDYYCGHDGTEISGRGRNFECLVWRPEALFDDCIFFEDVHAHFSKLGFYGHAGAFMAWRRICGLTGQHASVLDENHLALRADGHSCVPYSRFDNAHRRIDRYRIDLGWNSSWSFVAFREVLS